MLIDGIITTLFFVPAIVAFVTGPRETGTCTDLDGLETACEQPTGATIALALGLGVIGWILGLVYYVVPVARSGATPGKKMLGIKIVDARTLQPPTTGKALGRYLFLAFISAQVCYLGLLWAIWDKEKRTWHDMVCDTRVVRT